MSDQYPISKQELLGFLHSRGSIDRFNRMGQPARLAVGQNMSRLNGQDLLNVPELHRFLYALGLSKGRKYVKLIGAKIDADCSPAELSTNKEIGLTLDVLYWSRSRRVMKSLVQKTMDDGGFANLVTNPSLHLIIATANRLRAHRSIFRLGRHIVSMDNIFSFATNPVRDSALQELERAKVFGVSRQVELMVKDQFPEFAGKPRTHSRLHNHAKADDIRDETQTLSICRDTGDVLRAFGVVQIEVAASSRRSPNRPSDLSNEPDLEQALKPSDHEPDIPITIRLSGGNRFRQPNTGPISNLPLDPPDKGQSHFFN